MGSEAATETLKAKIPLQDVWETLSVPQQQIVLQAMVNVCQQIILVWKQEEGDEQHVARKDGEQQNHCDPSGTIGFDLHSPIDTETGAE